MSDKLATKEFWSIFGALVFTTLAFEFFPDPYSRDILKSQGLTDQEINRRFTMYFAIGLLFLLITTILFFRVIREKKI